MTTQAELLSSATPTTTKTQSFIGHWVTVIKAHEKLILVAIMALVLWHFGDEAYNAYGKHLAANIQADNAHIAQVEQQNAATQAQLATLTATVAANAKIDDAKIAASKQKLVDVQKIDAALPLPELSVHWQSLLSLPPGSITPQPNGTVAVTTDAAHATVNAIEKVGPLNEQLSATQDQLKGCTAIQAQQTTLIVGLNTDVATVKKGREDDAKQAKHDIHRAYFRGLKHGFILGAGATTAVFVAIFK
jgi:hypothetical protein